MALAGLKFCFIAGQKEKMPQMKFFINIVRCSTIGMHMKEITDYKNIDIENWLSKWKVLYASAEDVLKEKNMGED